MNPLQKKLLHKIGMGTWQIGGETLFNGIQTGWGKTDPQQAQQAIEFAAQNGILFFDTANAYGRGQSETILGNALKNYPNAIICTKFGFAETPEGTGYQDFSEKQLIQSVEQSLKRLKTDHLHILLLHSPPSNFDFANYDPHPFQKLVQQGKIGQYGVSVKNIKDAEPILQNNFGTVIQAIYNLLDRRAEEKILPLCLQKNTFFIARVPLASGFLTPKYAKATQATFSNTDIRQYTPPAQLQWLEEQTLKIETFMQQNGFENIAELALQFCAAHPAVSTVIAGMRTPQQVQTALNAAQKAPLTHTQLQNLAQLIPNTFSGWQ